MHANPNSNPPQAESSLARVISFVVLTVIVLVFVGLFVWVMAEFLLSLFLALILVVMFRPLHERLLARFERHPRVAALLTTLAVLLLALVPMGVVLWQAATECVSLARSFDQRKVVEGLDSLRDRLRLQLPPRELISLCELIDGALESLETGPPDTTAAAAAPPSGEPAAAAGNVANPQDLIHALESDVGNLATLLASVEPVAAYPNLDDTQQAAENIAELRRLLGELVAQVAELDREIQAALADGHDGWPALVPLEHSLRETMNQLRTTFNQFERTLFGNPLWHWLRLQANPQIDRVRLQNWLAGLREWAAPQALSTTQAVGGFLLHLVINLLIMVLALYYFLADGPAMIKTVMRLSPLDDRYENQMLSEFDRVSRAVVLATLLSALAQGLLAGVGYYFAGLGGVVLLTVLTMLAALVPFVGAAAIWGSCALYLFVVLGHTTAAVLLAAYGAVVVSLSDNLIKPVILHGQSNIHPLLALLSILGGMTALGPIGIFVGPMVVAFLQAVLAMMQAEIKELSTSHSEGAPNDPAATSLKPP